MNNRQLKVEVKKILQNSANPYINGKKKSNQCVREHWERFCEECKFPHPKSEFVRLEGLFDLLFQENQSPRFLMHNFTTSNAPIRLLQNGRTLDYMTLQEAGLESSRAHTFCLHGCGSGLFYEYGLFSFCEDKVHTPYGFVIFNPQFHEKICSRENISIEELQQIQEILKRSVDRFIYGSTADDMRDLSRIIRSVNGILLKDHYEKHRYLINSIGIGGMIALRKGGFYELDPDSGLRAVEITKERDYKSLPITPRDVKYLVEIDNSQHQIDYKVLQSH